MPFRDKGINENLYNLLIFSAKLLYLLKLFKQFPVS